MGVLSEALCVLLSFFLLPMLLGSAPLSHAYGLQTSSRSFILLPAQTTPGHLPQTPLGPLEVCGHKHHSVAADLTSFRAQCSVMAPNTSITNLEHEQFQGSESCHWTQLKGLRMHHWENVIRWILFINILLYFAKHGAKWFKFSFNPSSNHMSYSYTF